MPATLEIVVPASVPRGAPFIATVEVCGANPGHSVMITLEQKRGTRPLWPMQSCVGPVDERGHASVSFSMVLSGPGNAVLLATGSDRAGTFFSPDGECVLVR
ncbi:hypothetical protein BE08_11115 [Sorangium cellulosum]|uniref:Uncharacterized protein n=1 Tax=Sorangium cellulosum TaxID=56 RepID=A0A150P3B6_SORCE|nr:hypothetical protein BE08_11115 [Sorangium cellulosum]